MLELCLMNSMEKIRVLVADDHPLFQKGLCSLLKSVRAFDCVGVAKDGEEAVKLAQELQPDVVMVDVDMPKMTGIEAAARIKSSCPNTAVLILSAFNYDHYIFGCIQAGADGYLLKTVPPNELIDAIYGVHNGKSIFNVEATRRILRGLAAPKGKENVRCDQLHSRELEVLKLAARGMSNKQIASKLGISDHTVGTHLINIFRKLGVESRTEAALYAFQRGWLTFEESSTE